MAMMVLRTCQQVEGGLPAAVKSKMMFNIVLDFGIGLVPFLGDIADGKPGLFFLFSHGTCTSFPQ